MKKSFSNLEISILTLLYSFVCYSCLVISYSVVQVTLLRALADSTGTAVGTRLEAPGAGTTGRAAEAGPNPGSGVSMGSGPKVSFEIFVSKIFFHDRYANLGSNPRRNPRRIWLLFGLYVFQGQIFWKATLTISMGRRAMKIYLNRKRIQWILISLAFYFSKFHA